MSGEPTASSFQTSSTKSDLELDGFDCLMLGFEPLPVGLWATRPLVRYRVVHTRAHDHCAKETEQQEPYTEGDRPHLLTLLAIPVRRPSLSTRELLR